MEKAKLILRISAIIFIIFGFANLGANPGLGSSGVTVIDKPVSISGANFAATDNDGNIYLGNPSHGSMQIFDSDGAFLKGYVVPTSGGSVWMDADDNGVYIYVVRGDKEYTIKDGIIDDGKVLEYSNATEDKYRKKNDAEKVTFSQITKKVKIGDREIHIDAPRMPLSVESSFMITWLGGLMWVATFFDIFIKMAEEQYKNKKPRGLR